MGAADSYGRLSRHGHRNAWMKSPEPSCATGLSRAVRAVRTRATCIPRLEPSRPAWHHSGRGRPLPRSVRARTAAIGHRPRPSASAPISTGTRSASLGHSPHAEQRYNSACQTSWNNQHCTHPMVKLGPCQRQLPNAIYCKLAPRSRANAGPVTAPTTIEPSRGCAPLPAI